MRAQPALALLLVSVACVGPQPPVPVLGDIASLTGEWHGEYGSAVSGRSGSILFTLKAGTDTAHGDVLMVPVANPNEPQPAPTPGAVWSRPEPLAIEFVRAEAGGIYGRLASYRDPECGCHLETTFFGRLQGDTLTGTFRSRHLEMGRVVEGWWRATRKPLPATRP